MNRSLSNSSAEKQKAAVTFVSGSCWVALVLLAVGVAKRIVPAWNSPLASQVVVLLLVFSGLYWIGSSRVRQVRPLSAIGFVLRPTEGQELGIGMALGWGISIALVLPALLTMHLQSVVQLDAYHWRQFVLSAILLLVNAAVTQLVFTGLLFRSLVRATSEAVALACFSLLAAAILYLSHTADIWQVLFVALAQTMFSMAALRTRAVWLPFGIQVGWGLALQLVFGVSSFYWPPFSGVVQTYVTGPRALTGSYLGPEASAWAFVVLAAALPVLCRATRDFAWDYAFDPIESAGYPMDVAPPKEHTRMQAEAAAQPSAFVQIMPAATAQNGKPPVQPH